jgi:pyruvate/2-oxoglutarate dehydrogenase complex dihydrolipoamide dehydrogenase (E3) component
MAEHTYDVVVIGAGSADENVADNVVQPGLTAVIVEVQLIGGSCSYWGCMPSKALLRPAEALAAARRVPAAADDVTGEVDVEAVLSSRDAFTSGWDDVGQVSWLAPAGRLTGRALAPLLWRRLTMPAQVSRP